MATTTSYVLAIIILLNLSVTVLASLLLQQNQGLNDKWKSKKEVFLTWRKIFHRYEYRWADGVQVKKPIEVSAPKYVEYLMDWIETQLDDESIFPQKLGMVMSSSV